MSQVSKSSIQVRLDEELKAQAESVLENLGLDTPTAIRMFFKKVVATRSIPFAVSEGSGYSVQQEQDILNALKVGHEDAEVAAVTQSRAETQALLDALKS